MRKFRRLVRHIEHTFGLSYIGKRTYVDIFENGGRGLLHIKPAQPGVKPKKYYHTVSFTGIATANAGGLANSINQAIVPGKFIRQLFHVCHIVNDPFPQEWEDLRAGKWVERSEDDRPMYWCDRCGKSVGGGRAMFMKLATMEGLDRNQADPSP